MAGGDIVRFYMRTGSAAAACLLIGLLSPIGFAQDDDTCLACHADSITEEQHLASLHGSIGLTCVDCHADLAGFDDFPHPEVLQPAACGECHSDVQEVFADSLHGYALERGYAKAPTCVSCHGSHDIRAGSDPDSVTNPSRLQEICASCHGTAGLLTNQIVKSAQTMSSYSRSVHGPDGEAGKRGAATCTDCHSVHDLRGVDDPRSRIHRSNIAKTCGACHGEVEAEYEKSIHGLATRVGVRDSPTCTDCHGEHLILAPSDPDSPTNASHLATAACGSCHNDPVIIAKYNLRGDVVGSYVDSYHGWATGRGYASAATCVSCHTAHSVLPATHAESTISPDNLVQTCRQCHEGVDERFASSYTHKTLSITANPINRWIRNVYWTMIAVVIGGMIAHNLVILNFYAARRRRNQKVLPTVLRLDRLQLAQHALMACSFIVLAITGFALRFPDAWWVKWLSALGMHEQLRANVHRVAGAIMVLVAIGHVFYIVVVRRGRREFRAMLPARGDFKEALDSLSYYTWRRAKPADFGRYDYTQKAEYWALVWGTVLMVVTGAVLWFPRLAVKFVPAWAVTASQTVHYYEAWLAVLSIVFWHLFFVLFHPAEYPMNWTWLTGKMTARRVEEHHPRWYREESGESGKPE